MNEMKLTRTGARSVIAGVAVTGALMIASVSGASADQGHPHTPGHLPGHQVSGHHASGHHSGAPGHAGHVGAPGR